MAGLAPAIRAFLREAKDVDARDKRGHDGYNYFYGKQQPVGWAKARSAVPTRLIAAEYEVRSASGKATWPRFALPTLRLLPHWGAWAICGLLLMHWLAVIWHAAVKRDEVLSRMLPSGGSSAEQS